MYLALAFGVLIAFNVFVVAVMCVIPGTLPGTPNPAPAPPEGTRANPEVRSLVERRRARELCGSRSASSRRAGSQARVIGDQAARALLGLPTRLFVRFFRFRPAALIT